MIDTKKLQHFVTLAEVGNYNDAADKLYISQPALSRSIQALEVSIGLKLFDRTRRIIQLTNDGKNLLSYARRVILHLDNLNSFACRLKSLDAGKLAVGTGLLPANHIGARACADFLKRYPQIELSLEVDQPNTDTLEKKLISGEVDLIIGDKRGLTDATDFSFEKLPSYPFLTVARKGHPLAENKNLTIRDVRNYPFATISKLAIEIISNRLENKQAQEVKNLNSFICNSVELILTTIKHSDTIGMLLSFNVEKALNNDELCILNLPLINESIVSEYSIITYNPRELSVAAERFIKIIKEVVGEEVSY